MLKLLQRNSERRMDTAPRVAFTAPTPEPSVEDMMNEEVMRDLKVREYVKEFIAISDTFVSARPDHRMNVVYERMALKLLPMMERRFGPLK